MILSSRKLHTPEGEKDLIYLDSGWAVTMPMNKGSFGELWYQRSDQWVRSKVEFNEAILASLLQQAQIRDLVQDLLVQRVFCLGDIRRQAQKLIQLSVREGATVHDTWSPELAQVLLTESSQMAPQVSRFTTCVTHVFHGENWTVSLMEYL